VLALAAPSLCGAGFLPFRFVRAGSHAAASHAVVQGDSSSCWVATTSSVEAVESAAGTEREPIARALTNTEAVARHSTWTAAAEAATAAVHRYCGAGRAQMVMRPRLESLTAACDMTSGGMVEASVLRPSCRWLLQLVLVRALGNPTRQQGALQRLQTYLRMRIRSSSRECCRDSDERSKEDLARAVNSEAAQRTGRTAE
jgi:hypothetical protein